MSSTLKTLLLNVGGLCNINKQLKLYTHITNNNISIAFITETHLKSKHQISPFLKDWIRAFSCAVPEDPASGLLILAHPQLNLIKIIFSEPRHLISELTLPDNKPHL